MKNSNFKALVAKMDALKETEQGKLKGGVSTLNSSKSSTSIDADNGNCPIIYNASQCKVIKE